MRLLPAVLLMALPLPAQETPQVFRAEVSLVRVDAGLQGLPPATPPLTAGDFLVFDNGRPQSLRHFAHTEEPLDLILLFDVSGSMKPGVAKVAEGARAALAELRPGDRVAVFAFSNLLLRLLPFTTDHELVHEAVERLVRDVPFVGGTPLRHAIHVAGHNLDMRPPEPRRRAILVITDNRGVPHGAELEQVIHDLWRLDLVVTGLVLRMPGGPSRVFPLGVTKGARRSIHEQKYGASMDPLAEATGGEMLYTRNPERDFQNLIHRLRSRYSFYYPMPETKPGERRAIRVELTPTARRRLGRVKLHARSGYRAPGIPQHKDKTPP
ncbi:MAG: VWA domain-containing protein [Bryobacteraceae bacterium]|nr:VWA domain-containing protein [Bryobacteraceae bacterium]MCL4797216.1 VWA domain-containing protein [Bryobacteraceae bacterium]